MATRKNFPERVKARRKKALEQVRKRINKASDKVLRFGNEADKASLSKAEGEKITLEKRVGIN